MTNRRHKAAPSSTLRAPKIDAACEGVKLSRSFPLKLTAGLAVLLAAGCTSTKKPAPIDVTAFWPTFLGNSARAPFVQQQIPEELPNVAWSAAAGSGLRGMPVVTEQVIVAASRDRYINVLSRLDGSTLWRKRLEGPPVSPLVRGDLIYTATESEGKLRILSLKEGDDIWKWNLPSVAQPLSLAGDTLYAASEEAMLHALDTFTRFEIWRARFLRKPVNGPLVVDRWVTYTAPDSLHLVDRMNGNVERSVATIERVIGEAATDGTSIYVATETGSLMAWSLPDLKLLWHASGFFAFESGPVIADSSGYAVTRLGMLVHFELQDGAARVIAQPGGTVLAPPTVVENGILVGNLQGILSFYTRNGEPIWDVDLAGSVEAPVFVHRGQLVVPMAGPVGGPLGSTPIKGKVVELR